MFNALNDSMRKEAVRILREALVDVVIGFQAGRAPMKAQPTLIRDAEAAVRLITNGFGHANLALYLTGRPRSERIGLVCRGCESRAVRALVAEHQRAREHLYLIGIPCGGIIDRRGIESAAGPDILSAEETETEVVVATRTGEYRFRREDVLHDACRQCRFPQPEGVDILIDGPPREPMDCLVREAPDAFDSLTPDERYLEFARRTERCIRCHACRQACPMCYCTQCFADCATPRWIESTATPAGAQAWHIMRAFHQAGRCVGCGACERACPMDIKLTYLTNKLNRDMERSHGFVAGTGEPQTLPFAAFSMDDANRFER